LGTSKKPLSGVKVILGVTGSIAAYKAVLLLRELIEAGASVTPVMTENAVRFISPVTFSSLSKQEVVTKTFASEKSGSVEHIKLTETADILIIAPATANIIGKAAAGIADDFLSTLYLAAACPVVMAPAMNHRMYAHPQVQENISSLKEKGVVFVGPDSGNLACGEGTGRMSSPHDIFNVAVSTFSRELEGKTVLITSGPTREYIDPIRFISNGSSGRMGFSLAKEALRRGARVILISGPTPIPPPEGVELHRVVSAQDMYQKTMSYFSESHIAILTAAVGDFSPMEVFPEKIKKENGLPTLSLKRNKDILLELGERKEKQVLVGFSLETGSLLENAREKKKKKNCSIMVANLHSDGDAGIGSEVGKVSVILEDGKEVHLPAQKKIDLARSLWDIFYEHIK